VRSAALRNALGAGWRNVLKMNEATN